MKHVLQKPVQVGKEGGLITELVFREEPCAGDLRGIKLSSLGPDMLTDDLLKVAGRLCAQDSLVMDRLSIPDLNDVGTLVLGFLFPGPKTQTTP